MRALPAIVVSMIAHGLAIAWLLPATSGVTNVSPLPPSPPPAQPDVAAMVVELLDDGEAVSDGSLAIAAIGGSQATGASTHGGGESRGAAAPEAHQPTKPGLMKMRYPELQGMSDKFMAEFLAHSKPLAKLPEVAGEQLEASIAASEHDLGDWRYVANRSAIGLLADREHLVAKLDERANVELRPSGNGTYVARHDREHHDTFTMHVAKDGTAHFEDAPNVRIRPFEITFDVMDWAMRDHAQDPYASAKKALLEKTFDERAELGRRNQKELLSHSAELAQRNVERLWQVVPDVPGRKAGLFQLWDECAERGESDVTDGATSARKLIVGIIRARLVGNDAYTAAELAKLNAHRQSAASFAPYD